MKLAATFTQLFILSNVSCDFVKKPGQGQLNVLLIIIDDMRPDLKEYGHPDAPPTPNLNQFASSARTFRRAYAQVN